VFEAPRRNIYFELTEAFNATASNVVLASGQAVVYYRVAIMSKDGDWIIREAADACDRILALAPHLVAARRARGPAGSC
jgi:hypothetical protein